MIEAGATDSDASGAVENAGSAESMDLQASLAPRPHAGELKHAVHGARSQHGPATAPLRSPGSMDR